MSTTKEEHLVLGDVVRVLYDNAELPPAMLGAAWLPGEAVQVVLGNVSLEDQTRIWTSFGFKRFKLALYYKARIVPIGSLWYFFDEIVLDSSGSETPITYLPTPATDLPAEAGPTPNLGFDVRDYSTATPIGAQPADGLLVLVPRRDSTLPPLVETYGSRRPAARAAAVLRHAAQPQRRRRGP